MLWFGREEGLPEDRLGREIVATPQTAPSEPAPQPEPAPQTEPAQQPEPAPQPDPAPQPEPEPVPTPAPQPQPEPTPQPEAQPEPEPELETEVLPTPETEPETEVEPEAEAEVEVEPESEPTPVPTLPVLYVTGSRVNMRGGPSTNDGIVAALVRGTAVSDLGEVVPGWSAIRVIETGEIGYMATRFLSPDQP